MFLHSNSKGNDASKDDYSSSEVPKFQWTPAFSQVEVMAKDLSEELSATGKISGENLHRCHDIAKKQNAFVDYAFQEESPLQKHIYKETENDSLFKGDIGMLSGNQVGALLKMFGEMIKAKTMLEIGTYSGYGTVALGEISSCQKVYTLDVNEYSKTFLEKHLEGSGIQKKIEVMIGPAIDSLTTLEKEGVKFDVVFIDADKMSYIQYYKFILDHHMLNTNGIILFDNILLGNSTILEPTPIPQGKVLQDLVNLVKEDKRVSQILFPFRDGVLLVRAV